MWPMTWSNSHSSSWTQGGNREPEVQLEWKEVCHALYLPSEQSEWGSMTIRTKHRRLQSWGQLLQKEVLRIWAETIKLKKKKGFRRALWVFNNSKKRFYFLKKKRNVICSFGLSGELPKGKPITGWAYQWRHLCPFTLRSPTKAAPRGQLEVCLQPAACAAQRRCWTSS